jgi:hypothetical protein
MHRSHGRLALFVTLFVAHTVVSVIALREHGFAGIFEAAVANWGAGQIASDLTVSLVLVNTWLIADARRRGVSWLGWVLLSLPLGSLSAIVYLVARELGAKEAPGIRAREARAAEGAS